MQQPGVVVTLSTQLQIFDHMATIILRDFIGPAISGDSSPSRVNVSAILLSNSPSCTFEFVMDLYLLDYGAGNVQSLANSIEKLGHRFTWITQPADFTKATVS